MEIGTQQRELQKKFQAEAGHWTYIQGFGAQSWGATDWASNQAQDNKKLID